MARGRKANTPAVDRLRGNAGKRKREKERQASAAALAASPATPASASAATAPDLQLRPPVPADLPPELHPPAAMIGLAREIWLADIDILRSSRLFRDSDLMTFEVWCNTKARYRQSLAVVAEKGSTYESRSRHGTFTRVRPEVKIIEACERALARLTEQLALSTSSRTRLNASARQLGLPLDDPGPRAPAQPAASSQQPGPAAPQTDSLDVHLRDRPDTTGGFKQLH